LEALGEKFEGEQSHGVESVWVRVDDTTVRHELETGISDGVFVIVTKGLNVGDTVILSASVEKKNKSKK
jgi:ERCC4-type nuclease